MYKLALVFYGRGQHLHSAEAKHNKTSMLRLTRTVKRNGTVIPATEIISIPANFHPPC